MPVAVGVFHVAVHVQRSPKAGEQNAVNEASLRPRLWSWMRRRGSVTSTQQAVNAVLEAGDIRASPSVVASGGNGSTWYPSWLLRIDSDPLRSSCYHHRRAGQHDSEKGELLSLSSRLRGCDTIETVPVTGC